MRETTYEVDPTRAISETLDGETIIIDLETGTYYSMNETGSVIWNGVVGRQRIDAIAARLAACYEIDAPAALDATSAFVTTLVAEGLVREHAGPAAAESVPASAARAPFSAPSFETYKDLQEILLADPIHDVDAMGWPKLKDARS